MPTSIPTCGSSRTGRREIGTPEFGITAKDTCIDLVARTRGTEEYHAIQCKCYDEHHRIMRRDIDSFFTASGKKCFAQRLIGCWKAHLFSGETVMSLVA
jgi:predicted helicase